MEKRKKWIAFEISFGKKWIREFIKITWIINKRFITLKKIIRILDGKINEISK